MIVLDEVIMLDYEFIMLLDYELQTGVCLGGRGGHIKRL